MIKNYIPLLIWMLAFIPAMAIAEKLSPLTDVDAAGKGAAALYVLGCVVWIAIGALCSTRND